MVRKDPARLILREGDGSLRARLGRGTIGEVGLDPPAGTRLRRRRIGQQAALGAAQRARRIPVGGGRLGSNCTTVQGVGVQLELRTENSTPLF